MKHSHLYRDKNRKNWTTVNNLLPMKVSGRHRNVQVKVLVVCEVIVLLFSE